jgi:hypothetical protein
VIDIGFRLPWHAKRMSIFVRADGAAELRGKVRCTA